MIPVRNRPIIAYTIDALIKNGIRDIIVVVGSGKEQATRSVDLPIEVVVQEKQLGQHTHLHLGNASRAISASAR